MTGTQFWLLIGMLLVLGGMEKIPRATIGLIILVICGIVTVGRALI